MPQHIALPNGPGASSQWDPQMAATIWQAWADALQSTYVTTTAAPRRALVTFENLPVDAATVSRVTVLAIDAGDGVGTLRLLTYLAGVVDATAVVVTPLEGGYQLIQAVYDTAPGGLPWTVARRNALQAGVDSILAPADPGIPLNVDSVRLATDYETATADDPNPILTLSLPADSVVIDDSQPALVLDLGADRAVLDAG